MIFLVLGPQGSGKTTQAKLLSKKFNLEHFSTGNALREVLKDKKHPLYNRVYKSYVKGDLVDDSIVNSLLHKALLNCSNGLVIDGTPRKMSQLKEIDSTLKQLHKKLDLVFFIDTSIEESKKRILKRSQIEHRPDDTPESVNHRLALYHKNIGPILAEYSKRGILVKVDGNRSIEEIHKDMVNIVEKSVLGNDN
ncbi:MAG TPA: nucleoside monophosphate kinase [candidate division WWE3 bacterium]|uniref:Adenylate kinase n=1 Tax=candidate division WWE3 bacterium TaxID=2053526 RepID=A0A7V5MIK3_UNCKA|nr:nucleoside monophosphate kinase [candidate division WWE3 bacterium]